MDNLERWLASLGLQQLAPTLQANDVDLEILPELTEADLEKLGFSLGQRKKLLKAATSLRHPSSLPPIASSTAPKVDLGTASSAERRQLTVMFCDLVGSIALTSRLDPEDLREVIGAYHRCVAETVGRFDGIVAKYMGDGVLVYFGYPRAHEDDPERAVRAGLALIDAVGRLATPEPLQVRAGIATGLVVVGDLVEQGGIRERSVVGETPNLASRLQALAEANTIVIASKTHQLVGDLFEYRDLGMVEIKGFAEPVRAYYVLRPSAVESRFDALHAAALTPLVGRDEEIELLLRRWSRAKGGDGQVVLISGEPGIGKSRLTAAVQETIGGEPYVRLRYFCTPYHQDSALHPIINQLEHAAGFERDDTQEIRLDKLAALLLPTSAPSEDVALFADLLSIPVSGHYSPLNFAPQRKKEKTFEALLRHLEFLARQRPVLMVYEDVHWIDPTSRELMELTIERLPRLPVLLLITFRPEFRPPWIGQPHVTAMALSRLGQSDGAALVERITGVGMALPDDIMEEIIGDIKDEFDEDDPMFRKIDYRNYLIEGKTLINDVCRMIGMPLDTFDSVRGESDSLGGLILEISGKFPAINETITYDNFEFTVLEVDKMRIRRVKVTINERVEEGEE